MHVKLMIKDYELTMIEFDTIFTRNITSDKGMFFHFNIFSILVIVFLKGLLDFAKVMSDS